MWKNLLAKLLGIGKGLLNLLLPILTSKLGVLLEKSLTDAIAIVTSFEGLDGSGEEKRRLAVEQLRARLVATGKATAAECGTAALNYVVETALQNARATAPQE